MAPETRDHAYVANGWQGLCIIDVSDPARPADSGSYAPTVYGHSAAVSPHNSDDLSPMGGGLINRPGGTVAGSYAYVADAPDHLSLWAVLGETRRVFLSLVLRNY